MSAILFVMLGKTYNPIKIFLEKSRSDVTANQSTKIVLSNHFLKSSYIEIVEKLIANKSEDSEILEFGSAGGITKHLFPDIKTTDIRAGEGVDLICSVSELPFDGNEFDIVFAKDALHHVTNVRKGFLEVARVLKPKGTFSICEPYWGPLAQFIYRFLHPEDYSNRKLHKFGISEIGNQALARNLVKSKEYRSVWEDYFDLVEIEVVTGPTWLLSGGATFQSKISPSLLLKLHKFEKRYPRFLAIFGLHVILVFRKK